MTAPKRRWFRLGFATLFAVMAVGTLIGWQVFVARHRVAALAQVRDSGGFIYPTGVGVHAPNEVPIWRLWLGDRAIEAIHFPIGTPEADVAYAVREFSEAKVDVRH